jgi:hypothetical protein
MKTFDLNQFSYKQKRFKTDYLFATPTFLKGVGSVINIFGGRIAHVSFKSDKEADLEAIRNDFRMIGQDVNDSFEKLKEESEFSFEK